jgi:hypothetical protein
MVPTGRRDRSPFDRHHVGIVLYSLVTSGGCENTGVVVGRAGSNRFSGD